MTGNMGFQTVESFPTIRGKTYDFNDAQNAVQKIISWVLKECPDATELISYYNNLSPTRVSNKDILAELSWIVYASGFRFDVIRRYWRRISEAFHEFDVVQVALLSEDLEKHAQDICCRSGFKNYRKAKWCIQNAQRIMELDREMKQKGGLRGYFVELSTIDTLELVKLAPSLLEKLRFKGIGTTTIFHLMKNVGIDIFKPDIHVCRILGRLGLINQEKASILDICQAMLFLSSKYGIRISELDTLLFVYGKTTADNVSLGILDYF
jgi:3-methyladenine DNA glycosylase Tag